MADRMPEDDGLQALEAVLLAKRVEALEGMVERERAARRRERQARRLERESLLELVVAVVERRDHGTGGHCRRVAGLAARICRELGHAPDEATLWGFLLHDLGKVTLGDTILHKPGPLSPEEWMRMRRHPEEGAQLLRAVPALQGAVPIVLHHHERWDGGGYPLGLRGAEIPLPARAFMVADAFDAITEDRPYRRARPVAQAVEEILAGRGTQFDPDCVDAFLATVGRPHFGSPSPLQSDR